MKVEDNIVTIPLLKLRMDLRGPGPCVQRIGDIVSPTPEASFEVEGLVAKLYGSTLWFYKTSNLPLDIILEEPEFSIKATVKIDTYQENFPYIDDDGKMQIGANFIAHIIPADHQRITQCQMN